MRGGGRATRSSGRCEDVSFEVAGGRRRSASSARTARARARCSSAWPGSCGPTRARSTCDGKMSALLELGAGFHPELSGRENVYLNGAILGLSKKRARRAVRRDRRLRRPRAVHRHAGEELLVGHVRAARVLGRHQRRPRHPAHRRGARGRRRGVPAQVHRRRSPSSETPHGRSSSCPTGSARCGRSATGWRGSRAGRLVRLGPGPRGGGRLHGRDPRGPCTTATGGADGVGRGADHRRRPARPCRATGARNPERRRVAVRVAFNAPMRVPDPIFGIVIEHVDGHIIAGTTTLRQGQTIGDVHGPGESTSDPRAAAGRGHLRPVRRHRRPHGEEPAMTTGVGRPFRRHASASASSSATSTSGASSGSITSSRTCRATTNPAEPSGGEVATAQPSTIRSKATSSCSNAALQVKRCSTASRPAAP